MGRRKLDARRSEQITMLITKIIAKDMLPVSFVEGEGFRELMKFIEPEYTIPTRKTITTRVEKMHGESATDLRGRLASARTVSLTTDL